VKLFVTGATGFLGSEVLPRLLDQGHFIYALSRNAHISDQPNLKYVQGSVTRCLPKLRGLDAVLHMAALTSLTESDQAKMSRINTLGTENVAYFTLQRGIPLFYVSTVYVCGDHKGLFTEGDLDVGQAFKNTYERSKFDSERYLRALPGNQLTIFRPGILSGRHSDGHAGTFEGFYRPLMAVLAVHHFFEQTLGLPDREELEHRLGLPPPNLPIKITGHLESTLSITPVDWAASVIADKVSAMDVGKTYHVVPERVPRNREIALAVNAALGIRGLEFSMRARHDPLSLVYNRLIRQFRSYLNGEPTFTTSVGRECPPVNQAYLEKIIGYWRRNGSGGRLSTGDRSAEKARRARV
jgi:nucleoside-diphosphate-sugar epimerase